MKCYFLIWLFWWLIECCYQDDMFLKVLLFVLVLVGQYGLWIIVINLVVDEVGVSYNFLLVDVWVICFYLIIEEVDLVGDLQVLCKLVFWCGWYSLWMMLYGWDGIGIDIIGCVYFFGGEEVFLLDFRCFFEMFNLMVCLCIVLMIGVVWGFV